MWENSQNGGISILGEKKTLANHVGAHRLKVS